MTTNNITTDHFLNARDFSLRFANAINEYEIFTELNCSADIIAESMVVACRVERPVEGGIDYLMEHVFYEDIEDVSKRAYHAHQLANEMLAALLLRE